jgi:hypothetical protein
MEESSGQLLEIGMDLIAEGRCKKRFDQEMRRVFRELKQYEASSESSGKATVTLGK